ncbi:MAG: hypothetical protein NZ455_03280 [Bacteroidia bacterium]|nr:hypothetical protein [Bacteroidia bacterium]
MREACGGRASARCEAPRLYAHSCPGGGRVGRSTVSPQHADLVGIRAA